MLTTFLLVGLVLTGGSAAPTAHASNDGAAASSSGRWLADQLDDDGTLRNPLGGTLPDYGLMIDTLFALHASGDGALADPIVDHLDDQRHASDYFTWDGLVPGQGYDAIIVGGAAAKVLVAAEVADRDPRDFGGYDMVAETRDAIMRSGPDKGRISDYSKNPDFAGFVSNNANMFGQSLAVIGLAGVGENDQLAIDRLLSQQCSEGYFRVFFGYIPTDETGDHVNERGQKLSTCDEGREFGQSAPDGDTTGLALSAMLAARAAGAAGLDEPIGRTVEWLRTNQADNGGWGGGVSTEAPNTNSTGLIVQALADAGGAGGSVTRGRDYLRAAQVNADSDADNALADQIGAIAYTPEDYQAARTGGMVGTDTWIRATAQASLGLAGTGFHELTRGLTPPPNPGPGDGEDPPPSPPPSGETPRDPADDPGDSRGGDGTSDGGERGAGRTDEPGGWPDGDRPPPPPPGTDGGEVVVPEENAAEPGSDTPAGRLGAYLAGQLSNGDHVEIVQDGETYVDYDATADLVLALRTLDEQPEAVARATEFLLTPEAIAAYAHGAPYEESDAAYAEPLAKLRLIAGFLNRSANGDAEDASGGGSSDDASGGDGPASDNGDAEGSGTAGNGDADGGSNGEAGDNGDPEGSGSADGDTADTSGPAGNGGGSDGATGHAEGSGSAGNAADTASRGDGPASAHGDAEGSGTAGNGDTDGGSNAASGHTNGSSTGSNGEAGDSGDPEGSGSADGDTADTSGPAGGDSDSDGATGDAEGSGSAGNVADAGSGGGAPSAQDTAQDTAQELSDQLAALRTEDGRFVDVGTYADPSDGTRRHAWATLATTADGGSANAAPLAVLVEAQRGDGTFPETLTADADADEGEGEGEGDPFATALAVEALAGHAPDGGGEVTPERGEALAAAVAALNAAPGADGLVVGDDGEADIVLSAALAGARQAAGIDVSDTARSLGGLLGEDGGIAPEPGAESELPTSIAVAPGVAGASWTSAPDSPVTTGGSAAVDAADRSGDGRPGAGAADDGLSAWTISGLVAGGFAVAVALLFAVRHLINRIKTRKAVAA
ncbi:MSCRAMM family adhesin SdrC [Streptomyces profundus]|uniref:MSCRAMM family adhesin SdrC n=1 Tax=Streptomyces profundus TaxID=2867410 RepID=UPI001D16C23A|nr:MSCRAMM family adhesin SdrC [Streptomyces sp. MA3_2.13]UED87406.1 MSCRAMM family adhesin SdrC [Streptomyces sp. MA3_2.13]